MADQVNSTGDDGWVRKPGSNRVGTTTGYQDLDTGKLYDLQDNEIDPGPDQNTIDTHASYNRKGQADIVGNWADVQRAGALIASKSGTYEDGVITPPGVDASKVTEPTPGTRPAVDLSKADKFDGQAPTLADIDVEEIAEQSAEPNIIKDEKDK